MEYVNSSTGLDRLSLVHGNLDHVTNAVHKMFRNLQGEREREIIIEYSAGLTIFIGTVMLSYQLDEGLPSSITRLNRDPFCRIDFIVSCHFCNAVQRVLVG